MSAPRPSTLVDQVLDGRYRVLSHLADGGMATVYVALDQRLDREVALKVMRQDLVGDPAFVSRFRREARSAARLSHPHVVAVYDQGEDDGRMFLAMELVNGQTLRQVIAAEGPLTPRAALDILDPVLQALAAAHHAGLIHRDVKPENVILRDDGTVKVADFGLARAVTNATSTAQTGVLLGTVAYLSPEQVERGIADARSDVYAAGLLLFEMLTGQKAFVGDSPIHVAYQHVHGAVPVPSSRLADLPAELDALVAVATSRDPDDRPADAGGFLAQLRTARAALSADQLDLRPRTAGAAGAAGASPTVAMPGGGQSGGARTAVIPAGPGKPPSSPTTPTSVIGPTGPPVPTGAAARGTPKRSRRWPLVALILALLAAAAVWFFTAGPGGMTRVPTVAGLTQAAAQQALARDNLDASVSPAFDEQVAKGIVMASDPAVGTQLRRSSTVKLTVSAGPERFAVPALAGRTVADATAQLTDTRLTVGTTTEVFSEDVPDGQVVSSDPAAGALLKRGTGVSLVVSKGREPITVVSWVGKPADAAVKAMTAQKLTVEATQQQFSLTVPKGSVISQNPLGGTLFQGGKVVLVISKGPELVTVPAVGGRQEREATQILRRAGFQVAYNRFMLGIFGTVRSQSPAGNTQAPKGSVVTLTIV